MAFQGSNTFIEFCVDGLDDDREHQRKEAELSILNTAMERLGATLVQGKVLNTPRTLIGTRMRPLSPHI